MTEFIPTGARPAEGKFSAAVRLLEAREARTGHKETREQRRAAAKAFRLSSRGTRKGSK